MKHLDRDRLLRGALLGNAAFSALCGLLLLAAGGPIAARMGLGSALVLRVVGLSLLPFAVGLLRNARRDRVRQGEAWTAVALDAGWVLGSLGLLAFPPVPWTPLGRALIALVAAVVGLFALLQAAGLSSAPWAPRPVPSAGRQPSSRA